MNKAWKDIERTIGKKIKKVHVALFVYKRRRRWDDSPLQITFADDSIILLKGDGNDNLRVTNSAWKDEFQDDLSQEDKDFIQKNGKWSSFDVSETQPFDLLLEKSIQVILPILNQFNTLNGVQFQIGDLYLNFVNIADQSRILWGDNNSKLLQWGCRVKK